MKLEFLRIEIERMRVQIRRQRSDIQKLHRAGINTMAAEELLARMQNKTDELCAERDRRVGEARMKYADPNKFLSGASVRNNPVKSDPR